MLKAGVIGLGQIGNMGGPGAGMAAKIARNVIVYNVWRAGDEARSCTTNLKTRGIFNER